MYKANMKRCGIVTNDPPDPKASIYVGKTPDKFRTYSSRISWGPVAISSPVGRLDERSYLQSSLELTWLSLPWLAWFRERERVFSACHTLSRRRSYFTTSFRLPEPQLSGVLKWTKFHSVTVTHFPGGIFFATWQKRWQDTSLQGGPTEVNCGN